MREFSWIGIAALSVGTATGCTTSPVADGGNQVSPLATQLLTETNGAGAAKAYQDHVPTPAEANQIGAFLAYVVEAEQTGGFDQGFMASSLVSEVHQIALEYPDFFVASADGGIGLKPHFIDNSSQITCGVSCEPSATAFTNAITSVIPSFAVALDPSAASLEAEFGQAAATLEQEPGTSQGQAFDQAIASADAGPIDAFIAQFITSELQPADLAAAESLLGLSATDVQQLDNAVAGAWAGIIEAYAETALLQASQLQQTCVTFQASCATTGTATATTGGTSGTASGGTGTGGFGTTGGTAAGGSTGSGGAQSIMLGTGPVDFSGPVGPLLAADTQGNLLAVWRQFQDVQLNCDSLNVAFFSAATQTWSATGEPVANITYPDGGGACLSNYSVTSMSAALSDNGDALVTWPLYETTVLMAIHYDHTTGLWDTRPTQIAPGSYYLGSSLAQASAVALNSSGAGWVLFLGLAYACEDYRVLGVSYAPGSGFSQPVIVDPDPSGVANSKSVSSCTCTQMENLTYDDPPPGVVALSDDSFVAAWGQEVEVVSNDACNPVSANNTSIMVGARGTATAWGAEFQVSIPGLQQPNSVGPPTLRGLAAGGTNVVAIWNGVDPDGGQFDALDTSGITGLQPGDSTWESFQMLPAIHNGPPDFVASDLDPSGAGMVTWQSTGPTNDQYVAPISLSLQLGAAQDLTSLCPLQVSNTNISYYGTVAVNSDGGAAVDWVYKGALLGSTYAPSSGWSACSSVEVVADGGIADPIVANTGNGEFGTLYGNPITTAGQVYFLPDNP